MQSPVSSTLLKIIVALVPVTRYDGELREPIVWRQGSQVWMREARGSASLLSREASGVPFLRQDEA